MVMFVDGDDDMQSTCPAQILSFVNFASEGFPQPDPTDNNSNRNNLYAIVHTATRFITWEELESAFIVPFCLGDVKTCVYSVNVTAISAHYLFVLTMGEMDCTTYVVYHINVGVITLHKNCRPQNTFTIYCS